MRRYDYAGPVRAAFVSVVLMLMVGCAPFVIQYRYISLEKVAGIEITETADPELDRAAFVEGAYFVNPIPVSYVLQRPAYVLRMRVPRRSLGPVLTLRIEPRDGTKLKMTGFVRIAQSVGGYSFVNHDIGEKTEEFEFSWIPGVILVLDGSTTWVPRPPLAAWTPPKPPLAADARPKFLVDGRLEILFDVVNDLGEIIAKEALPFEVKSNGFFWGWDSL